MATIGTYDFPDHVKGDTFAGIQFTVVVNSSALILTGASIKAKFIGGYGFTYTLSTISGLTITGTLTGIFKVDVQTINWVADIYNYDIEIILQDGTIHTYLKGSWTILQDKSNG